MRTAVIGLGSMGYGIAQSCVCAGHETFGFDVVEAQVERFRAEGGQAGELDEIADSLDAVVVVVLNATQLEMVLFGGDGIANRLREGAVVIACPTVSPEVARRMEAGCLALGVHYLDAPISGGSAKAAIGQLSVMASGTAEAFAASRPLLRQLGHRAGCARIRHGHGGMCQIAFEKMHHEGPTPHHRETYRYTRTRRSRTALSKWNQPIPRRAPSRTRYNNHAFRLFSTKF